jgi:anti-anti-sigma regulatory factor
MATVALWTKIQEESAVELLRGAMEKLDGANGEITLDFSSVQQVDASIVGAVEELIERAERKDVRVALRGVNVDVYKVFKLVKLSSRFVLLD